MPQMSPLSWVMICLMLLFTMAVMVNVTKSQTIQLKKTSSFKHKENTMKW